MPAQFPKGQSSQRIGIGRRTIDRLGWSSNPRQSPRGERTFLWLRNTSRFGVSGVTRNNVGTALGDCEVRLFKSDTDQLVAITTSDGSGNFTFTIGTNAGWYWIEAYKAGGTDVAGTSLRTLAAVMV